MSSQQPVRFCFVFFFLTGEIWPLPGSYVQPSVGPGTRGLGQGLTQEEDRLRRTLRVPRRKPFVSLTNVTAPGGPPALRARLILSGERRRRPDGLRPGVRWTRSRRAVSSGRHRAARARREEEVSGPAAPGHTAPGVRSAPPCGETRRGTWLCVGPSPPERPLRKEQPRRRGPGPRPGPRLGPPLSVRRPPPPPPPLPAVCRRPARAAARGARLRVPPPQRAGPATARHGPSATLTRRCCSLPIVFTHIFLKLRKLRF